MLMEYAGRRLKQPNERKFINARNNECSRGRRDWFMVSWRERSKGNKTNATRDRVLAALDQTQLTLNTTRGSTPGLDRFGNVVPTPTRRRHHPTHSNIATTTAANTTSVATTGTTAFATKTYRPTPQTTVFKSKSKRPSARREKSSPSHRVDDLSGVDGDIDHEDGNSDDEDLDALVQPISRPKRKRLEVVSYKVEDQSEDSDASEYEPDVNRTGSKSETPNRGDDTFEGPHARTSVWPLTKQLSDAETQPQRKKKRWGFEKNAEDDSQIWNSPSSKGNNRRKKITDGRLRHVQEIREHRLRRAHPHATSSALNPPELSLYAPHGAYEATSSSRNIYSDASMPSQAQSLGTISLQTTSNSGYTKPLPDSAAQHGIGMPHFDNAPYMFSDAVPQAHFMHSNAGQIPPNSGYPHRAMGDASQLPEQYFEMAFSDDSLRVPPVQSTPTANYLGYQGTGPGHQTPMYTAFGAEADQLSTLPSGSLEQQYDDYVQVGLLMHHEPPAAHWSVSNSQPSSPALHCGMVNAHITWHGTK